MVQLLRFIILAIAKNLALERATTLRNLSIHPRR